MNLNSVIAWSIFMLMMASIVFFFRIRNRKRNGKKLAVLNSFANEYHCTITTYDIWENTLLGISGPETNKLFFIRSIPGREIRQVINLSEVAGCRMLKTERKQKYNKEIVNVIDRIELLISFNDHRPDLSIEFYNIDYNYLVLTGELQLAQKWSGMIESVLSANGKRKKLKWAKAGMKPGKPDPNGFLTRRAG